MKSSTITILVVDDEEQPRRLFEEIFSEKYKVKTASSVEEAMERLEIALDKETTIDIVLTDIKMPGDDGLILLRKIKRYFPEMPIILITGHGDKKIAIEAIKHGAFDFLEKPCEEEELHATMNRAAKQINLKRQLKLAQAQAFQSTKLASIGELAAGVGHEINNPLTIIKGQLRKFQKYADENNILDEKYHKALLRLDKSIERISKIVNGLSTFVRMDNESMKRIDTHEHIEDTLQLVESIYKSDSIEIKRIFSAENAIISDNIGHFHQVIMNLMSNAKDALENQEKPCITIETWNENSNIAIRITDNGVGIERNHLDLIFESFFSTKPIGKGTGLGLSISHSIINEMGGKIDVVSELGVGTSFTVTLPLFKEKGMNSTEEAIKYKKLSGVALVVDDEPDIREMLSEQLQEFGLIVDEARDGEEALEKIKNRKYGYIFTDLKMPKMNGEELIKEVRKLDIPNIKIFAITGGITGDFSGNNLNISSLEIDTYILKPFTEQVIYDALTQIK